MAVGQADASAPAPADNAVRVHSHNLAEFAVHGAKYAFPAQRLPVALPHTHNALEDARMQAELARLLLDRSEPAAG